MRLNMISRICFPSVLGILALLPLHASVDATTIADQRPSPATIDRLYRLDCGHSKANDESVWTPGENVGKTIEFSSTCYLIRHGSDILLWDTGVPDDTANDPAGWSTLPKLIVYHLDRTITSQLAELGLKPEDVNFVLVSHTHGDHIGNVRLFPDATVVMQKAEYEWITSTLPSNPNLIVLVTLARKLLGQPKRLELISGDVDLFRDGSVELVSTPGHTPGSQSLMVRLKKNGYIILSGDVVHLEGNFDHNIVPTLNVDKAQSLSSMQRVRDLIEKFDARFFINHDKMQADHLKLLPAYYD
jgi:N-acyl homoserine lactone hydrolase